MKKWWLRLYTFPAILEVLKASIIPFVVNLALAFLMPKLMMIGQLFYLYPLMVIFKNQKSTFSQNIDLHKVNIPYAVLRKAYFLDACLQSGAYLFIMYLSIYVPTLCHDEESYVLTSILDGTFSFNLLMFISAFLVLGFFNLGASVRLAGKKAKLDQNGYFQVALFLFLIGLYYLASLLIGRESQTSIMYLLFMSLFCGSFFYLFYMQFGKNVIDHVIKRYFAQVSLGFIFSLTLFYAFSFSANQEVHNASLGMKERFVTFSFWPRQINPLDVKTVKGFLEIAPFDSDKVLSRANPSIYQYPVEQIFLKKDFKMYISYLRHGKVTKRNLSYLTQISSAPIYNHEFVNADYYPSFKKKLTRLYPKAKDLPEALVFIPMDLPSSSKRATASEVKHEK